MVIFVFSSFLDMTPNYLTIDGYYACFWFDESFNILVLPVTQLKNYENYAKEYHKVFGCYPEPCNNYSWARILSRLKRNSTATK